MNKTGRKKLLCWITAAFAVLFFRGQTVTAKENTKILEKDQTLNIDPSGKEEGYSAVLYNSTNGLPTSEANAIEETSEGFIWIGSYSGLIRYDGNTFE